MGFDEQEEVDGNLTDILAKQKQDGHKRKLKEFLEE